MTLSIYHVVIEQGPKHMGVPLVVDQRQYRIGEHLGKYTVNARVLYPREKPINGRFYSHEQLPIVESKEKLK